MTDGLIKTRPREDLTGRVFGRLTVLRQGPDFILVGKKLKEDLSGIANVRVEIQMRFWFWVNH